MRSYFNHFVAGLFLTTAIIRPVPDPFRIWSHEYIHDFSRDHLGPWLQVIGRSWDIRKPESLAAGQADGRIPADVVDYSTGNAGGAFASLNDAITAANAADLPLALGVMLSPGTFNETQCYRGIYGYAEGGITFPSRDSARLAVFEDDVVLRGLRLVNAGWIIRASRATHSLIIDGELDTLPYHSGSDPAIVNCAASSSTRRMRGVGHITPTGDVDLVQIYIKRVAAGTAEPALGNTGTWNGWNPFFEGYVDGVNDNFPPLLSGPIADATAELIAADINANTGTHGFRAKVLIDGRVRLLADTNSIEPLYLLADYTGTGTVECDTAGVGVDISCCEFIDCNQCLGGVSMTTAFGSLILLCNKGEGSWGLVNPSYMRFSFVRCLNNHFRDAQLSRPTAPGRTNSRMPIGSNTNSYNTTGYFGINSAARNGFSASDVLCENNTIEDGESNNQTDTNNCAVAFHVLTTMNVALLDDGQSLVTGQCSISWNKVKDYLGVGGAEDCQPFYAKAYGLLVERNYVSNTGAAFVASGAQDGSEATFGVFKELRANANMPPIIVQYNVIEDQPWGKPILKIDNLYHARVINNLFRRYRMFLDGAALAEPSGGPIRIDGNMKSVHVIANKFEDVDMISAADGTHAGFLSAYDLIFQGGDMAQDVEISNNVAQNSGSADYPEYTGDYRGLRFYVGTNAPSNISTFWNTVARIGLNQVLDAAGAEVGDMTMYSQNGGGTFNDNGLAISRPYEDADLEAA